MSTTDNLQGSTREDVVSIFVSLELSRTRWLVTSTFHGSNKMSRTSVAAGDGQALLDLLAQMRMRAKRSQGLAGKIIAIQEAGVLGSPASREP